MVQHPDLRRLHILVISENPAEVAVLRQVLGEAIIKCAQGLASLVVYVPSVEKGLEHLARQPVDMIVLDADRGGWSSADAVARLREAAHHVPVVALTRQGGQGVVLQNLEAGAQEAFSVEGLSEEELGQALCRAFDRQWLVMHIAQEAERARLYLDIAGVIILGLDREGRVVLINRRGEEIVGLPEREIVGKVWVDHFVPEKVREETRQALEAFMRGEAPHEEYRSNAILTQSGETRLIAWHNVPLTDEDGRCVGLICSGEDITERHRAELALRASEAKLRAVIDQLGEGIVLVNRDGEIVEWNAAAERITGLSRSVILNGKIWEVPGKFVAPERRPEKSMTEMRARILEILHNPHHPLLNRPFEHPIQRPDGQRRIVQMTYSYIQAIETVYVCALVRDITDQRRLEEQLHRTAKMEAIGRLAAGVAHDFNNALTAINGFAQLLLAELADDGRREMVEEILRAGGRASAIARQLLVFSRQQPMTQQIVSINEVLRNMVRMLGRVLGEDILLQLNLAADLPTILADPTYIEQIIMNLAINARDAMPTGGQLILETVEMVIDEDLASERGLAPGHYVRLSVEDTGHGMPPDVQARLFEPFFTTKEPGRGTGLGLATVYSIARQLNGFITVYSEVGRGTIFHLYFPVHGGEETASAKGAAEPWHETPRGQETILLVEDETQVRNLTARILERQGYRVFCASGPKEALEWMASGQVRVDLVLTDVVMPEMDGFELVKRLRAQYPGLRALYMSGYTEAVFGQRGQPEGMPPLLQKPFDAGTLIARVRQALDTPHSS